MRISNIKIRGFKKFREIDIDFNNHLSVLVGENEVGKSDNEGNYVRVLSIDLNLMKANIYGLPIHETLVLFIKTVGRFYNNITR